MVILIRALKFLLFLVAGWTQSWMDTKRMLDSSQGLDFQALRRLSL